MKVFATDKRMPQQAMKDHNNQKAARRLLMRIYANLDARKQPYWQPAYFSHAVLPVQESDWPSMADLVRC